MGGEIARRHRRSGQIALLFGAFWKSGRPTASIAAALILATAQHFTWIGRTGRIDVPLTFTVTAAVLGLRSSLFAGQLAGYVAVAAGVLFKGPIGIVLPAVVLGTEWLIGLSLDPSGTRGRLRKSLYWGLPLVLALTVPWFVAVHRLSDGEFTRVFFWYHHFQRATGGSETLAIHPWWTYLVRWAVDVLPWSPLFLAFGWAAWRTPWLRDDPWARLGCAWMVSVTVLLSLSKFKRADYLLPAYPGFASRPAVSSNARLTDYPMTPPKCGWLLEQAASAERLSWFGHVCFTRSCRRWMPSEPSRILGPRFVSVCRPPGRCSSSGSRITY